MDKRAHTAETTNLAPWWQEQHRLAQEREFARGLASLPELDQFEVLEILRFLLWRQHCGKGQWQWPDAHVVYGCLLHATEPLRLALARAGL